MRYRIDKVLAEGYTIGSVKILKEEENVDSDLSIDDEIIRFNNAIKLSLEQINKLKEKEENLNDYLSIQELMVKDPDMNKRVKSLIFSEMSAEEAVSTVIEDYLSQIIESPSSYLRERASDMEDVLQRILFNLNNKDILGLDEHYILYVDKLYPSLIINLHEHVLGVIAKEGGYTSHSAILCRSWDIPYCICDCKIDTNDTVILDTRHEVVIVNPENLELNRYLDQIQKRDFFDKKAVSHEGYLFLANVGNILELNNVVKYGFDGVGLFRTEIIFMNSDRPYTLEEQLDIYSKAIDICKEKPICFRTFDVGDDKKISYLQTSNKGIENYINNPKIFESQVLAIMMANKYDNVKIMFPMIESIDEFNYLKDWVLKLQQENNLKRPQIGMMLETKKALESINDFINVDFISIGTNDLTKDLYKIDREKQGDTVDDYLEDLLEKIAKVVKHCDKNNITLSVCGEHASIKRVGLRLYGLGIKNLSICPSLIRTLNLTFTEFLQK